MVSRDRSVKKDVFYFYKANWSSTPTLHLAGRRYIDRSYETVDVKAYSNASQARLSINGHEVGAAPCNGGICVWPAVHLMPGVNKVAATAEYSNESLADSVQWIYSGSPSTFRIKAGDVSGYRTTNGTRYGSDNFFLGGEGRGIDAPDTPPARRAPIETPGNTEDSALYDSFRTGTFSYSVPVPDGTYVVTASFMEPAEPGAGKRVFDVVANGRIALSKVDPFALAGARLKMVDRTFTARATGGRLHIGFRPQQGEAIVSALQIVPARAKTPQ
jgi:beta-galactosidase